jgi:hypothetical protein
VKAKGKDLDSIRINRHGSRRARLGLAALLLSGTAAMAATAYESPPTLRASELAKGAQLIGPHYRVDEQVATDGFLTRFTVHSDFGDFAAVGPGMLDVRIREVGALAALQKVEQSSEFQAGAKAAANKTLDGIKRFVDEPTETLKGIPEGVGRFFQRTYRSAKTGVQKLTDVQDGRPAGAPPAAGPGANLPGGPTQGTGGAEANVYAAGAKAAGSATLNALGFDDARRRLAKRVGVDPYTTNRPLAKQLDEVAWTGFAGDLGVDLLTAMIPGGTLVATSTRLSNWVWDMPPGDLRLHIEKSLLSMGVSQADVDLLLRHRWYPLSLQAALVVALDDLAGVDGRVDVMPLALTVASEEQARFLVQTLQMTARYHKTVKPLEALVVLGTVAARAKDGEIVVAAPVDYLTWNEGVDRFTANDELAGQKRSVHIAGRLTDRASAELQGRGWAVHPDSALWHPILPPPVTD